MGGAGMVDLRIKDMCLKLGWLNRLKNLEGSWKDYIVRQLPKCSLEYLLECNIKLEALPGKISKSSFWYDVLQYW